MSESKCIMCECGHPAYFHVSGHCEGYEKQSGQCRCYKSHWDVVDAENKKLRDTVQKLFDDWDNRGSDTTDIDQYLAWMELEEMLK